VRPVIGGLPLWVGHFVLLSALQTAAMAFMIRRGSEGPSGP
jgi:hypothetical protein